MQLDVQSYTSEMNIQDMLSKLDQVEDSTQSLSQNNVLRHESGKTRTSKNTNYKLEYDNLENVHIFHSLCSFDRSWK